MEPGTGNEPNIIVLGSIVERGPTAVVGPVELALVDAIDPGKCYGYWERDRFY